MPTPELDDAELAMVIAALKEKLDRNWQYLTVFPGDIAGASLKHQCDRTEYLRLGYLPR